MQKLFSASRKLNQNKIYGSLSLFNNSFHRLLKEPQFYRLFSTASQTDSTQSRVHNDKESANNRQFQDSEKTNFSEIDFEKLLADPELKRIKKQWSDPTELKQMEEALKYERKSKREKNLDFIRDESRAYGKNFEDMLNTEYVAEIDVFKNGNVRRNVHDLKYDNLNNYKFKNGQDYQILLQRDDVHYPNTLNYIDKERDIIKNKFSKVVDQNKEEHYSKYAPQYAPEVLFLIILMNFLIFFFIV